MIPNITNPTLHNVTFRLRHLLNPQLILGTKTGLRYLRDLGRGRQGWEHHDHTTHTRGGQEETFPGRNVQGPSPATRPAPRIPHLAHDTRTTHAQQ